MEWRKRVPTLSDVSMTCHIYRLPPYAWHFVIMVPPQPHT
jgi:hypothetical protein